jgi:hypothetical protein
MSVGFVTKSEQPPILAGPEEVASKLVRPIYKLNTLSLTRASEATKAAQNQIYAMRAMRLVNKTPGEIVTLAFPLVAPLHGRASRP